MAKQKATMNSFFKPKIFAAAKKPVAGPSTSSKSYYGVFIDRDVLAG